MNPWWNLPFAVLVVLAFWFRVGESARLVDPLVSLIAFFGVTGRPARRGVVDFLAIAGVSGLLFVGWSDQLAAAKDAWLACDAVLSSLGLGLVGAWILDRLGRGRDPGPGPAAREMTMIAVEELPGPDAGAGESSAPDSR